jgi:3-oxoacyl-[acyl-carrier protein] reductase
MRFDGKVVIVTGAGKGIGAAIANGFAREGGRLALLDVDGAALDRLVKELMDGGTEVMGVPADVTRAGDVGRAVEAVVARWGRVDVLVNNAGGFSVIRRTEEIPDDEWDTIFRFNVTSIFLCTKAVLPIMKRQRAGRIVNMSSVAGRAGAVTVTSHYAAAKAAVIGFTRHVAREVAAEGITVNAVAPGTVGTERWKALRSPEESRRLADNVPMRRVSEPAEIAECVMFLASDAAAYMTGATLDVNGGLVMM